ncbi:hypothetical protein [Nocardia sp. NPDC052566]|uniref:hypothetical protein n=1 Tax=Nocardia sp. NPDC052566 TaxID=3364330 RepID=UPI0037C6AEA6
MTHVSGSALLALHAIRLKGFVDTQGVADRFRMPVGLAESHLREFRTRGWISRLSFGDDAGWSLTEQGREENERALGDELAACGARVSVETTFRAFLPLNKRLVKACTAWQMTIHPDGTMRDNDHSDTEHDRRILAELESLAQDLTPICAGLTTRLARFTGYDTRFGAALTGALAGDPDLITGMSNESCHRIWFELHEDLIATLGIDRAHDPAA